MWVLLGESNLVFREISEIRGNREDLTTLQFQRIIESLSIKYSIAWNEARKYVSTKQLAK